MSERMRSLTVVLVGIASVIVAVAVTVSSWTVVRLSAAARVTVVRPGASSPGVTFHGYQVPDVLAIRRAGPRLRR